MCANYAEAAALLFGSRPFTVREFSARISYTRASRILSELKTRGVVARIGRGRYRLLGPDERPDLRAAEWNRVYRALRNSQLPMVWTDADAVQVWTGGCYTISPSVFIREFHIEVPRSAVARWRDYLRSRRISTNARRGIGARVILSTSREFRVTMHGGEPVISRRATLALIRAHPGLYANAAALVEREIRRRPSSKSVTTRKLPTGLRGSRRQPFT